MPVAPTKDPLARAALDGDLRTVEALVRAEPAAARGWHPIMNAAFGGHPDVVRVLLANGADPNVLSANAHRHRPLHRAIEHKETIPKTPGHVEVVEVLLGAGADPGMRATYYQVTALQLAAMGGGRQFLPALRARGGQPGFYDAAAVGEAGVVEALLASDPELARALDVNGWTALQYCAASRLHEGEPGIAAGLLRAAERLLDLGADPTPALSWAAAVSNHAAMVALLLRRGADPNDGDSLYHAAEVPDRFAAVLELLCAHGADLDRDNVDGHHQGTPLGWVAATRRTAGVRWLLDQGADPNRRFGARAETALHVAARVGASPDLVGLLLGGGADRGVQDADGKTALALARERGHAKLVDLLAASG